MGTANASGVSFCWVGDDPIFLDLARDRYLALSIGASHALRRAVDGTPAEKGDDAHIGRLIERGLLVEISDEQAPAPCRPLPAATVSVGESETSGIVTHRWSAVADVMKARASLRIFGLAWTLARIPCNPRRGAKSARTDDERVGPLLARSFRDADALVGSLDLCVPRSVAMARRAAQLGYRCNLVIGVKLRPFAAHCWVQRDDVLLNEQIDVARQFTPILVI